MAYSERELLARLIQCEAGGEGETGMKAVAGVIMNRVRTLEGEYARVGAGDIYRIVFQPLQFECAEENGGQNLYNMRPTQQEYAIADWALAGNRLPELGEALWFYNPRAASCRAAFPSKVGSLITKLGNHCFYAPTGHYTET